MRKWLSADDLKIKGFIVELPINYIFKNYWMATVKTFFTTPVTSRFLSSSHHSKPTIMQKVFTNKWFILASLLTISLTGFSFIAWQKTQAVCAETKKCCNKPVNSGEMFWDLMPVDFPTISF